MKVVFILISCLWSIAAYSCITVGYNGLRLDSNGEKPYLINTFNYKVALADTALIDSQEVIQGIKSSDLADKEMIVRVLQMYSDPVLQLDEILKLCCTYKTVAEIVVMNGYETLTQQYKPSKLKKLMKMKG